MIRVLSVERSYPCTGYMRRPFKNQAHVCEIDFPSWVDDIMTTADVLEFLYPYVKVGDVFASSVQSTRSHSRTRVTSIIEKHRALLPFWNGLVTHIHQTKRSR